MLARQTYGAGTGKLIIPGGYIEQGESSERSIVSEYKEETSVTVKPVSLIGIRFNMQDRYVAFKVEYIDGAPADDSNENS